MAISKSVQKSEGENTSDSFEDKVEILMKQVFPSKYEQIKSYLSNIIDKLLKK